jgi:hypothetical protein
MENVRSEVSGRINWKEFKAKLAENPGACYEFDFGADEAKARSCYVYAKRLFAGTATLVVGRGAKVFIRA